MPTVTCPGCDADVHIDIDDELHDIVDCVECGTDLEIVGIDPVEVEILEEEYDYDEDEDEDY